VTRSPFLQFVRALAVVAFALTALVSVESAWAADEPRVSYAGHSVVRAIVENEAQLARVLRICPKVHSCHVGVGVVEVVADKRQQRELRREGIRYEVRIADLQPMLAQERVRIEAAAEGGVAGASFFDDFKPYTDIMAQLDALAAARPDLAQVLNVGTSVEGRAIKAIRISGSLATKPGIIVTGCQHAREWISPMTAMFVANALITGYDADPQIQLQLDALEFYIVPIVNPDGYVYTWGPDRLWRKNRNINFDGSFGVDLNRNWLIGFGGPSTSDIPSSDVYPGLNPFSEPETLAVALFVINRPNIITSLDLHSYGQLVLQPWSYTTELPPSHACVDEVGAKISSSLLDVHGEHYPHGSGNSVIYLAGGTIHDYMFTDQGMMAYTIELRPDTVSPGFILPPEEIIPTGEEIVSAVLTLADVSRDLVYLAFHHGEPEFVQADQSNAVELAVLPLSSGPLTAGTGRLFARVGSAGPFTQTSLTSLGDLNFEAILPAAPCGQVIDYYFQFTSESVGEVKVPAGAPAQLFQASVRNLDAIFHDDMETSMGWIVGAPGDDATSGVWARIAPNQTTSGSGVPAQPGFDNPDGEGTMCWFTGQDPGPFAGSNDVDNGTTTLTSPPLDAAGSGDAYISYSRWFSNNTGSNPNVESMPVMISNDDGQSWTELELVSFNETKWTHRAFRIADFVQPTSTMRVRFIARDVAANGGSIVEAGVDDLKIVLIGCDAPPCLGDMVTTTTFQPPGDGLINGADLAYLLGAWGVNPGSLADLVSSTTFQPPPDGVVDGADLAVLLGAWGGCE
jgi:hypothetical protein